MLVTGLLVVPEFEVEEELDEELEEELEEELRLGLLSLELEVTSVLFKGLLVTTFKVEEDRVFTLEESVCF